MQRAGVVARCEHEGLRDTFQRPRSEDDAQLDQGNKLLTSVLRCLNIFDSMRLRALY